MPNEKKPSGAEFRKRRKEGNEAYRRRAVEMGSEDATDLLQQYRDIPPPPDGALGGIAYANRIAVMMLREIATDPLLDAPDRRKQMKDTIAVIGMTSSKALQEERILEIERKLGMRNRLNDAADDNRSAPTGGKTLRARRGAGRIDALSGSLPELSPEGEGEADGD